MHFTYRFYILLRLPSTLTSGGLDFPFSSNGILLLRVYVTFPFDFVSLSVQILCLDLISLDVRILHADFTSVLKM